MILEPTTTWITDELKRTRVIGGWIITHRWSGYLVFVKDSHHLWQIPKKVIKEDDESNNS